MGRVEWQERPTNQLGVPDRSKMYAAYIRHAALTNVRDTQTEIQTESPAARQAHIEPHTVVRIMWIHLHFSMYLSAYSVPSVCWARPTARSCVRSLTKVSHISHIGRRSTVAFSNLKHERHRHRCRRRRRRRPTRRRAKTRTCGNVATPKSRSKQGHSTRA